MDETVLTPTGRLDSVSAPAFLESLKAATAAGGELLVIDFSQVAYISSAGLRVVLIASKTMAAKGGRLELRAMNPQVAEVIEVSGFAALPNLSISPGRDAVGAA